MGPLLRSHHTLAPTSKLKSWASGQYSSYRVLVEFPVLRVHEKGTRLMSPPVFDSTLLSIEAIQRSGMHHWFSIDAYELDLTEYLNLYAIPNPPTIAVEDDWLLQVNTLLNIGIASDMGTPGAGGGIQAEFVFGSPKPVRRGQYRIRRRVNVGPSRR